MFTKFIHPTQPLLTQNLDKFTNSNKFCVLEVGNDVCNWRKVDHPPSADTPLRRQSFCWESATTQFGQNCTMKRRILSYRPVSDLFVLSKEKTCIFPIQHFINFAFLSEGESLLTCLVCFLVEASTCVDQLVTAFTPKMEIVATPTLEN